MANPSFDVSVIEFLVPFFFGAQVVLVRKEERLDVRAVAAVVADRGITFMAPPPAFLPLLCECLRERKKELRLDKLLTGVEPIRGEILEGYLELSPEVRIVNGYGPTECTISSVQFEYESGSVPADENVPIGTPLANTTIVLLDGLGQLVPTGAAGEVFIGGEGVAAGYLGRPSLTKERFVELPFFPGMPFFRTGDIARWLPGGQLVFIGRWDRQVKLRGYRIELGEIESALSRHDQVREAAVVCREERRGDRRLVAYTVPRGEPAAASDLKEYLERTLPRYMIPSFFVSLTEMPLTASGKTDRKALPPPDWGPPGDAAGYAAPRNESEARLAAVWEKVLDVVAPGVRDSFFESGGDSLLAATLMLRIDREFGRSLPLATLFEKPTIEELSLLLAGEEEPLSYRSMVPIRSAGGKTPFFCVHPLSGNVLCYRDLARHLGGDQPFYAFQAIGFREGEIPLPTVEEMAESYLAEMTTVQPEGPYLLGGMCMGGMVAFEMARRLSSSGEEVALLAMMDTAFGRNIPPRRSLPYYAGRVGHHLKEGRFLEVTLRALRQFTRLKRKFAAREETRKASTEMEPHLRRLTLVNLANADARDSYVHQPFAGRITYFWGASSPSPSLAAWEKYAQGGIEPIAVPSAHTDLMQEPAVRLVAERLRECMERVCPP